MTGVLTIPDVLQRVEEIRLKGVDLGDDEAAHIREDALWADVLTAIAAGHPDPAGLALAALATQRIKFARWCA